MADSKPAGFFIILFVAQSLFQRLKEAIYGKNNGTSGA